MMGKEKKQKSVFAKILSSILIFIAIIIILIAGWFGFCSVDKKNSAQAIPNDFTIHVRTDSAWDALEPILDLKAADLILADKAFSSYRELFLKFRQSSLRRNFIVKKTLQRRIDISVYEDKSYLIVANMGIFSGISRLFPLVNKFLTIENLSTNTNDSGTYYTYQVNNQTFYIKIYKNLVVLTPTEKLFNKAITFNNISSYSEYQLKPLTQHLKEPFKISADGKKLLAMLSSDENNIYVNAIANSLSKEEFSTISFNLTDSSINLKADFPFTIDETSKDHPVAKLVKKESTVPGLLSRLPENVQYYTFLNSLTMEELVNGAFSVLPSSVEIDKKWKIAETASELLFKASLEDILFSWTDTEFAICGVEGKAEPIIAIKIKDEKKRQEVFDQVLSSITFKNDTSLLIDGVRLPKISVPIFLQTIISAFGVNIPEPYYIIKNDYIYFSQSPENLVTVYNASSANKRLSSSENWTRVSSKQIPTSTVSLYYNLERSIPFFLKSKTTISDILKLYNIGRFDVSSKNNQLKIQLQAIVSKTDSTMNIPGFPIELNSSVSGSLSRTQNDKSKSIFWIEDKNTVSKMSTASLTVINKNIKEIDYLIPCSEQMKNQNNGELWAVSKSGTIYLLTKDLEIVTDFPIYISKITTKPVLYQNGLLCTTSDNKFVLINSDSTKHEYKFDFVENILSSPTVVDNYICVYEKSFIGGLHLLKDFTEINTESFMLDGIAYGSPILFKHNKKIYIAIITQNGLLNVLNENLTPVQNFPLQLDGLFYINVQFADGYIFALSSKGSLYQIDMNANILQINIPNLKVKSGYISTQDYNNDGKSELFINGEENTIYGFSSDLSMLENFPVSGFVAPIFIDVNGDNVNDCITLTIDNKIYARDILGK